MERRALAKWTRKRLSAARHSYNLRNVDPSRTPRENFGHVGDDDWLWTNTFGVRTLERVRASVPALPKEGLQRGTTGATGDATLREAHGFYCLVKASADRWHDGGFSSCADVLDYGCGWGRIARFFLKDVDPERLLGIDCVPAMIEAARATNRWSRFETIEPLPPTLLPSASVDLVYAYSVFSHLAEEAHLEWLREFQRLVRPGGLVVVTTRARSSIGMWAEMGYGSGATDGVDGASALAEIESWKKCYDAGEFCHTTINAKGGLDDSFYGETAIPEAYARKRWSDWFEVVDWIDDRTRCPQAVAVLRRASRHAGDGTYDSPDRRGRAGGQGQVGPPERYAHPDELQRHHLAHGSASL